jgi:hypothetical protein
MGGQQSRVRERPSPTTARLSTLAAVAEHLDSRRGRPRQPDVVRECLGWGAFATVVVPAVLMLTGAEVTTAVLGAGAVAAVSASIFVVVRMTRLSLPRLGTSQTAHALAPPPSEPQGPGWVPDPVEAERFYSALEQPLPPVPAGQPWPEPWQERWETHWEDEDAWMPDGAAAPAPHSGHTPPQPPWRPAAEPLPWAREGGFAEVYHPPEPWLPEPRAVEESELRPAEQRGRHRRGP